MLKKIMAIFTGGSAPPEEIQETFVDLLGIVEAMVGEAGELYWEGGGTQERREALYRRDIDVNKKVRRIRRLVTTHLAVSGSTGDIPYGLLMMSLVKDVERIGDYCKNLVDVSQLVPGSMPRVPAVQELSEVREAVEALAQGARQALVESDEMQAAVLIQEGRQVSRRCDEIVEETARSELGAAEAVKISTGARFYKRIEGHFLNLISSVVMPLDKLDFYDESLLPGTEAEYESDGEVS